MIQAEPILPSGYTEASQHLASKISLFLGGFPQVRYTRFTSPLALCNHSTQTIPSIPPRCFIYLVVLLGKTQVQRLRNIFIIACIYFTNPWLLLARLSMA